MWLSMGLRFFAVRKKAAEIGASREVLVGVEHFESLLMRVFFVPYTNCVGMPLGVLRRLPSA